MRTFMGQDPRKMIGSKYEEARDVLAWQVYSESSVVSVSNHFGGGLCFFCAEPIERGELAKCLRHVDSGHDVENYAHSECFEEVRSGQAPGFPSPN